MVFIHVECSCKAVQPLTSLFLCDFCCALRCRQCSETEVACFYCPNCLFEVPSSSAKAEKGCCSRSCFQCPACTATLVTVASRTSGDFSNAEEGDKQSGGFRLECPHCKWTSSPDLIIDKPTGIASKIVRNVNNVRLNSIYFYYV
jgi:dynactin-4